MEDTWGIPGPMFVGGYLLGFSIALLFAFAVRIVTRSGAAVPVAPVAELTPLELACLTGGPWRVVEAAVAQLVETGQLRASRDGYLQIGVRSSGANPVERTVLADVARHGRRSATMLTFRLAKADSVGEVMAGLVRSGYLVDDAVARRRGLAGMVPVAVVFATGVMHWLAGAGNDRPIGWLTLVLAGTGLVGYALYRQPICPKTFAGVNALRRVSVTNPVELVAAGGFASHPDRAIRESLLGAAHRDRHRRDRAATAGGGVVAATWWGAASGSGAEAGSSGGSSGCGGGGCGG